MSSWTYVSGFIAVSPIGGTQPQKRYILETVLEHLPVVSGSERNMKVHIVQKYGYNCSSSMNEFDEDMYFRRNADCDGWYRTQRTYLLVLEAALRDRVFEETLREFNKWMNRLAKRVFVEDILVRVEGYDREIILKESEPYQQMNEPFSWQDDSDGEPAWVEYLLWDRAKDSRYPLALTYKYYADDDTDAEFERRAAFYKG